MKLDSCVIIAGKFSHPFDGRLSENAIFSAVSHAIQKHAALSARIVDERGPQPSFGRISEVNLDQVVRFLGREDHRDLADVMEEEFANPIDASKVFPLWRITVSPDNYVLFSWHHAIGDGQSGLAVLRTILEGLNQDTQGLDKGSRIVKPETRLKFSGSIEELTDVSVSFKTFMWALSQLFIPPGLKNRNVWTGNNVVANAPASIKNKVRVVRIDESTSSRLISSARAHKATLTAVLYVLALVVLTKLIREQPSNKKFKRLASSIPISLRPLMNLPATVMAETVSGYVAHDAFVQEFSWDKATAFSARLRKEVPKSREVIGTMKFLNGKYEGFFKGKLGKKRGHSMELSNIGAFKTGEDEGPGDRWWIGDTYFAQDDRYLGAALKLNTAGSPTGSVNICITWGEGVVGDGFAEAFAKGLEESILELSNKE